MVDISVGPEKELFRIHKDLLCGRVQYFERMFNGGFKEAQEQAAFLPEDDAGAFAYFVKWLYSGDLSSISAAAQKPPQGWLALNRALIRLHAFADKICETDLADRVMTLILSIFYEHGYPPPNQLVALHGYTSSGTSLHKFIVDLSRYCLASTPEMPSHLKQERAATICQSKDMAVDIVMSMAADAAVPNPLTQDRCYYHLHAPEHSCGIRGPLRS